MRLAGWIGLGLGLVLFTAVVVWQGAAEVATALAVAGWGLVVVAAYHVVPLAADGLAWRTLLAAPAPSFLHVLSARWIGDAVNSLLPAGQVAGDVVRARLLTITTRTPGAVAGASVVVDVTLSLVTQILFTLAGVGLLVARLGRSDVAAGIVGGVLVFVVLLTAFYRLQRRGLFGALARLVEATPVGRAWLHLVGGADRLDAAIGDVWRRPRAVLRSAGWNLGSWILGCGEVWLAMRFLGHPVTLADAVVLESLGQAARGAAFFIPGGLGVQEGSYVALGHLLGVPPDVALALSLAKRAREVLLGVPGLLAWQGVEGRRLARSRRRQRPPAAADLEPERGATPGRPRRPRS